MTSISNIVPLRSSKPESVSFFQQALHAASCPILIIHTTVTGRQNVVHANTAFQCLTGYAAQDIVERDWTLLFDQKLEKSAPERVRDAIQRGRCVSQVTLPVRRKDGSTIWTDVQVSPIDHVPGHDTYHIVVLRDVTAERRFREELEHHAHHDPLTGLANRRLLQKRLMQALARCQRNGTSFVVAILDMNDFKLVNDRFGHDVGDELLKCVGNRLKKCVRAEDTVARLGGDEFVLLVESAEHEAIDAVIPRIARAISRSMLLNGHRVSASCSMGISRYPLDGQEMDTLLKAADLDLYRTKGDRKAARGARPRPAPRQYSQQLAL